MPDWNPPPIPWTELATKSDIERFDTMDLRFDALVATINGNMIGLEGRPAMRFTEATRVIVVAVLLLMTGMITALIAGGG